MIIEELFRELELLLSDIAFAGLHNTQPITLQKLEGLKQWMVELYMPEGIQRVDLFINSMYAWQAGEVSVEVVSSNLCALEFYEKTILSQNSSLLLQTV